MNWKRSRRTDERIPQAEFAALGVDQFQVRADHVLVRRHDPELFDLGWLHGLLKRGRAHQKMVGIDPIRILDQTQAAGCIRLRIAVHEQRVDFRRRKRRGQIDGSRGLAHATLLVGNCYNTSHFRL